MNQYLTKFKSLSASFLVLILIVIVALLGLSRLFHQFNLLRTQISTAKTVNNQLHTKLDNLRRLQNELSNTATTDVVTALPSQNSALLVMSQLRLQALTDQLDIFDIKISASHQNTTGLSSVSVDFVLTGPYNQILTFTESLPRFLPLVALSDVEIQQKLDLYEATISLQSFWSPFPETLPPVTEPITALSPAEHATILELSQYIHPSLLPISSLSPSVPDTRDNPFAPLEVLY